MCAQFLFFSGLKVVNQIKKDKSTGDLTPLPYVSMYTNCAVWSLYGVMVSDYTILAPNVSGLLLGLYCTKVYSDNNTGGSMTKYYAGSGGILAAVFASALALPTEVSSLIAGYVIEKLTALPCFSCSLNFHFVTFHFLPLVSSLLLSLCSLSHYLLVASCNL